MLQPWSWYDHIEDESRTWKEFQLIGVGQMHPSRLYFFEKSLENEKKPKKVMRLGPPLLLVLSSACSGMLEYNPLIFIEI